MKAKKSKPSTERSRAFKRRIVRAHLATSFKHFVLATDIDFDLALAEAVRMAQMDPRVLRMRIKAGTL